MANKSKANADSGKVGKAKSIGRPRSVKRSAARKKDQVQETHAAPSISVGFDPTEEQIQMRAYFISERRRRFDLPGDANSDWLEAKRQLLAETRR